MSNVQRPKSSVRSEREASWVQANLGARAKLGAQASLPAMSAKRENGCVVIEHFAPCGALQARCLRSQRRGLRTSTRLTEIFYEEVDHRSIVIFSLLAGCRRQREPA